MSRRTVTPLPVLAGRSRFNAEHYAEVTAARAASTSEVPVDPPGPRVVVTERPGLLVYLLLGFWVLLGLLWLTGGR